MKKFVPVLILFLLVISNKTFAQVFVSPNSFMYVADNYVYVNQNVNIQNTGNIYLRNQSQLLQATTAASTNTGAGKLSVFQEGSVNNFQYNYWCSPVGNSSSTIGNEPFGISMINRPTGLTSFVPASTTAMAGYNGIANPLQIEPFWIWKYLSSDGYNPGGPNGWIHVLAASTIQAGEGFTMKGTSGTDATVAVSTEDGDIYTAGVQPFQNRANIDIDGSGPGTIINARQRYDFRGKPNDGNITINVDVNKFTLTGNPYPSTIDLKSFLASATNSTGIAYFWEHDKSINSHFIAQYQGGYGTYSPIGGITVIPFGNMGVYSPADYYAYNGAGTPGGSPVSSPGNVYQRRFCPVGQGFMLRGNVLGTVQMNNTFRVFKKEGKPSYSEFERNSNNPQANFLPETPSVSGFDYTTVSILPVPQIRFSTLYNDVLTKSMVLAFDPAATDGVDFAMDAKSPNEITADEISFIQNSESYVIDVINFDVNKKLPIGLRNAEAANYKITVGEILNFDQADHVFVHDKDNDTFHDIKNGVYEVNMPAGNNTSRFEITFLDTSLSTTNNSINEFTVLQNNNTQFLTISNPKNIDLKEVSLFDLTGKQIFSKTKLGSEASYEFSTSGLSDAIYIVKMITNENLKQGVKISVFKSK